MSEPSVDTAPLQIWIDRLHHGDVRARDELIRHACDRLQRLARKMLRGFPGVKRWEDTHDVFQNAVLRLCKALQDAPPASVREFFGLAALQIRRELLDLSRHYYGPQGQGANHASRSERQGTNGQGAVLEPSDVTYEPSMLARLTELHRQISYLPAEEREVFDLLWYQELPQAEAAAVLGISVPTIKRRWLSARRRLHKLLQSE
jgi:RNA polymerase sigma-70 factor (ECF subfamily)